MDPRTSASPRVDWSQVRERYLDLLLDRDRQQAMQLVLDLVERGADIRDLYLEVFQASQVRLGELWEQDRISVATEHYCTAATQHIISALYPRIFAGPRTRGRTMVMACVSAELHEIGARMVADFYELDGWRTRYLSANVPTTSILAELSSSGADLLGLSVSMPDRVPVTAELIARVRGEVDQPVVVIVGGRAFNLAPDLWRKVGADGHATDAMQAVTLGNALVEGT